MKKKTSLLLFVAIAALALTGCGKFTCDLCGEEKTGKQYKSEILGQEIVYCSDCKEGLETLGNLFN